MKSGILLLFSLLLFVADTLLAQCNPFYNLEEGRVFELTHYNKKDKVESVVKNTVQDFTVNGSDFLAVIRSKTTDSKSKEVLEGSYEIQCKEGVLYIDPNQMIPNDAMAAYKNVNVTMEGDDLQFPSSLEVGMALEDASFTTKIEMEGNEASSNPVANLTVNETNFTITNRKVENKENISTPAGTFNCYKISYTLIGETKIFGIKKKFEYASVEWIAKGVGVVKSESYNAKGKLLGYTMLTAYK
ncbi:hypothetical protein AAG747_12540 [Rapidithrix thailandica]|uniref:DUF3108 domain-containing protein n=1 Tax=Rapidithrix thailandica TaxID=413964 RepID=A0AAW9RV21_9BACT